jgi:DNA replication protein DnaC
MPRFVFAMKENLSSPNDYYQYVHENLLTADLVVWDEINYKEWTSFESEYMLNVISQRLSKGLSNIYTTNYDLETISKMLGTRLASRIIGCSEHVEFVGKDRRNVGG